LKVLHIITGLGVGGAEAMLLKLLTRFRADGPECEVLSLAPEGPMAAPIRALGVPVSALGLGSGAGAVFGLPGLIGRVRRARPDVVQCWMNHGNLMGGLAARAASTAPVLWSLRQSNLDPVLAKRGTMAVLRLGARFSRWLPDRILCVSESARRVHAALGYDESRMVVIPNGFDLDVFRPDPASRRVLRGELGIGADDVLVGLAARFDPQKDIGTFLAAAARVAAATAEARFLLCGEGMDAANPALARLIADAGVGARVHLLGRRTDMPRITSALDIAVSSSAYGEGFSNALGEALACAVPAVSTDVGDARQIVGEEGRIVPIRDPVALAAAIAELIALGAEGRARLGQEGRARMARDYALDAIARRYRAIYDEVLAGRGSRS
jgi:glycosyltransferase involved in cell wall biosynthesis